MVTALNFQEKVNLPKISLAFGIMPYRLACLIGDVSYFIKKSNTLLQHVCRYINTIIQLINLFQKQISNAFNILIF